MAIVVGANNFPILEAYAEYSPRDVPNTETIVDVSKRAKHNDDVINISGGSNTRCFDYSFWFHRITQETTLLSSYSSFTPYFCSEQTDTIQLAAGRRLENPTF